MALNSSICLGRHRWRKLFYLKIQGTILKFTTSYLLLFIYFLHIIVLFFIFFFVFKLIDMSEKLWQVYNKLDPVSLEHFLSEVTLFFIHPLLTIQSYI